MSQSDDSTKPFKPLPDTPPARAEIIDWMRRRSRQEDPACHEAADWIARDGQRIADLERQLADEQQRCEQLDQGETRALQGWKVADARAQTEQQRADRLERECAELRARHTVAKQHIRVAFIHGFQQGAEYPDDSGDGDAMGEHLRRWLRAAEDSP